MESIIIKLLKQHYRKRTDVIRLFKYMSGSGRKKQNILYSRGKGCSSKAEKAASQFFRIQEAHGKTSGRLCYHLVVSLPLSLRDDWIDIQISNSIAEYIFEELGFQTFFCIRKAESEKECVHTHYAINALNYTTGKKMHMNKKEYFDFQNRITEIIMDVLRFNGWGNCLTFC